MVNALDQALLLHRIPLFQAMPANTLIPIARLTSLVQLSAGEVLFRAGEFGDALYLVIEGRLAVIQDQITVSDIAENECVGELAVLDWEPRSATVSAIVPSTLLRLGRNDLMDLLQNQPALLRGLITVLAGRLRSHA